MTLVKLNNRSPLFSDKWMTDFFGHDMNELMTKPISKTSPAVNIKETDTSFELEVAAPGFTKDDFNVTLDGSRLTISAKSETEKDEKEDAQKVTFRRREFSYNNFSRSFTLPQTVNKEAIEAGYENGILEVSIPKMEVKKVEVKTEISIK